MLSAFTALQWDDNFIRVGRNARQRGGCYELGGGGRALRAAKGVRVFVHSLPPHSYLLHGADQCVIDRPAIHFFSARMTVRPRSLESKERKGLAKFFVITRLHWRAQACKMPEKNGRMKCAAMTCCFRQQDEAPCQVRLEHEQAVDPICTRQN